MIIKLSRQKCNVIEHPAIVIALFPANDILNLPTNFWKYCVNIGVIFARKGYKNVADNIV